MKWVALIYAAEWISVGLAVSTAIHVTGNLRALWFFLIPALFGVSYHDGDEGEKKMKYCVEISEEQLRIISVAVDEYMRLRMGQFEPLTEDLVFDGEDKKQLYEKPYDIRVYNERKHCIETMFEAAYKLAYPPFGHRERQHDSWGTCIDLVHAIEHQQWLDAPENKREAPGTTNRSFDPVPLGHEPFPKIERVDE